MACLKDFEKTFLMISYKIHSGGSGGPQILKCIRVLKWYYFEVSERTFERDIARPSSSSNCAHLLLM